ncbi:MAG: hypothetical protein PHU63_01660 [Candidatus ainarchaeum sp.]|nr:hypothetical protein [Candidatus ainarchaeum sp.]
MVVAKVVRNEPLVLAKRSKVNDFFRRHFVLKGLLRRMEFERIGALVEERPSDARNIVKLAGSTDYKVSVHAVTSLRSMLFNGNGTVSNQVLLALNEGLWNKRVSGLCAELLVGKLGAGEKDVVLIIATALLVAPEKAQKELLRELRVEAKRARHDPNLKSALDQLCSHSNPEVVSMAKRILELADQ